MGTSAKVIADSISESGVRLTTLVLEYPRIIHSEFMTHRMFSRNASSSRAIPVIDNIKRVQYEGFTPSYLGKNQKGMQASAEVDNTLKEVVLDTWKEGKQLAVNIAEKLYMLGTHKQLANRVLEPFNYIQVVVTATEWDNFFLQRLDKNAQPEIQELAKVMKEAMNSNVPKLLTGLFKDKWHLPFIDEQEDNFNKYYKKWHDKSDMPYDMASYTQDLIKVSVARCARVSYGLNERGWGDIDKDLALYDMLISNGHWSPTEHQGTPIDYSISMKVFAPDIFDLTKIKGATHIDRNGKVWSGNFNSWIQNRQLIQQSI